MFLENVWTQLNKSIILCYLYHLKHPVDFYVDIKTINQAGGFTPEFMRLCELVLFDRSLSQCLSPHSRHHFICQIKKASPCGTLELKVWPNWMFKYLCLVVLCNEKIQNVAFRFFFRLRVKNIALINSSVIFASVPFVCVRVPWSYIHMIMKPCEVWDSKSVLYLVLLLATTSGFLFSHSLRCQQRADYSFNS